MQSVKLFGTQTFALDNLKFHLYKGEIGDQALHTPTLYLYLSLTSKQTYIIYENTQTYWTLYFLFKKMDLHGFKWRRCGFDLTNDFHVLKKIVSKNPNTNSFTHKHWHERIAQTQPIKKIASRQRANSKNENNCTRSTGFKFRTRAAHESDERR